MFSISRSECVLKVLKQQTIIKHYFEIKLFVAVVGPSILAERAKGPGYGKANKSVIRCTYKLD